MGNYIKPDPSSNRRRGPIVFTDQAAANYYLAGNVVEGRPELTGDNTRLFDRAEFTRVASWSRSRRSRSAFRM